MFYRPGVGLSAYRRLVAVADAWLVRRVEEFDLVTPFSGGAALEEAAAWEAGKQSKWRRRRGAACQGARLLAEVERLSAARAKGKKGTKKKNVGVGGTGAARLNEEMLCS